MTRLTPSQRTALLIVHGREQAGDPETWISNANGSTYIAAGSARKLEELGLVEMRGARRYTTADRVALTDAGRARALEIEEEIRS